MKKIVYLLAFVVLVAIIYFVGPKPEFEPLKIKKTKLPSDLMELENFINKKESNVTNLKPKNESRIIWFDSIPQKTKYSIVYLHGWSASSKEGGTLPEEMAKRYGCNLYLPRLAGHGIEEKEPMLDIKANELLNSANEAINIAKQIGERVILISTSTGGTLSLQLAQNDADIAGLVLFSPNIQIFDTNSKLLTKPWGLKIARMVTGSNYFLYKEPEKYKGFWTTKYRLEALCQLQFLVDETMRNETFKNINQPLFLGYYYKNEEEQDDVVSVPALLNMFEKVNTPSALKKEVAFPNAGNHVLTSPITSNSVSEVKKETIKFLEEVLELEPVKF